jgi:hypothetical protein
MTKQLLSDARSAFVLAVTAVLDDNNGEAYGLFSLAAEYFRAAGEDEKAHDAERRADECLEPLAEAA